MFELGTDALAPLLLHGPTCLTLSGCYVQEDRKQRIGRRHPSESQPCNNTGVGKSCNFHMRSAVRWAGLQLDGLARSDDVFQPQSPTFKAFFDPNLSHQLIAYLHMSINVYTPYGLNPKKTAKGNAELQPRTLKIVCITQRRTHGLRCISRPGSKDEWQ